MIILVTDNKFTLFVQVNIIIKKTFQRPNSQDDKLWTESAEASCEASPVK